MDVKHNLGGGMHIILAESDVRAVQQSGFYVEQRGLHGPASKTWVRVDRNVETPLAEMDEARNLHVYLPEGAALPVTIPHESIHEVGKPAYDSSAEFYFGRGGQILVSAQVQL